MSTRLEELRRRQTQLQAAGRPPAPTPTPESPGNPPAARPPRQSPRWLWPVAGVTAGVLLLLLLAIALRPRPHSDGGAADEPESNGAYSAGTGWVAPGGLIVTNQHVIAGADRYAVYSAAFGPDPVAVQLLAADAEADVAVLQAPASLRLPEALPLARADAAMGESVFTIGFPVIQMLGVEPKLTDGKVSATSGIQDDPRHLQISVPIQPGNSGGPLFNSSGEVVGIVVAKLNEMAMAEATGGLPQNVNYAIKVGTVRTLLGEVLRRHGRSCAVQEPQSASVEVLARRVRPAVVLVLATNSTEATGR